MGLKIVMATGDGEVYCESSLPMSLASMKYIVKSLLRKNWDLIARLQHQGLKVAMAGDGINDAPRSSAG